MFRIFRILIAVCACAAACPAFSQAISAINALVEVVDSNRQPGPSTISDVDVTVRHPLIAGSIFGTPNTGDVLVEQVRVGVSIDLNVVRMRNTGARLASPVEPQVTRAGLVVEPGNARFARFGTFVFNSQTNRVIGFGSFIDRTTRTALALVYFDEPCRISGLLRVGTLEAEHNISVRSSGLYWIRIKELGNNRYELENVEITGSVILGIEPLPQRKPGQGA